MSKPTERKLYSVWIYGPSIGWWLEEEGYDNFDDAAGSLSERVKAALSERSDDGTKSDVTGGAIVPDGKFPMPMCDGCLKAGRIHHPKTGKAKR